MSYTNTKNLGDRRLDRKEDWEKALPMDSWAFMLTKIESTKDTNPNWRRDHAIVFLAGALGLRVGECALLERNHFRDLREHDVIHCPTLKQSEKIQFICHHTNSEGEPCGRKCRVKVAKAGTEYPCPRCGKKSTVPRPKGKVITGVVEKKIDIIESQTVNYALDYIDNVMRPDQRFLFEGATQGYHITSGSMNRIFNTYLLACGLNPKISFHSLRHLRGVRVWSTLKDMKAVQGALRHKNIAASQIYADLDADKKRAYKEALEDGAYDPFKKRRGR